MNIAAWMERAGRSFGTRPAVAHGEAVYLDYAGLADRIARLAGGLRRLGFSPGDRIGLVMRNCLQYPEALGAIWHAGMAAVPINARLHPAEFRYILENSGARACLVTADLAESVAGTAPDNIERLIVIDDAEYRALASGDPVPLAESAPEDPAWLFYTSGTTGRPKGAMLSHRNILAACACYFIDVDPEPPWDCILHAAPFSHGSGFYGVAQMMKASCQVIPESGGFDPYEIFTLIQAWPGLSFFAAPTMAKRLIEHREDADTANLKLIIYGGGPMYVEDLHADIARFGDKFAQLYGQGESPMTVTALNREMHAMCDHPRWHERLASAGVAQSAVEVRCVDANDVTLPPGETGEVLVRGDTVMLGYWGDPEATAETLRGGWLHTGDVGSFDEDGFLTLKDRSKDMIISGGTNIYPREIEEVLLKHPEVAEISCIGRAHPEWGEIVVAYVVARNEAPPDPAALDTYCLDHIARFKRPKDYRFVDSLPKNNYGKVLKTALREQDAETVLGLHSGSDSGSDSGGDSGKDSPETGR